MTVVISQPMYFPWVGMHEQIQLADTFVYYDDVAFSKGSFTNRVQVKTHQGVGWLTVPLSQSSSGQKICEIVIDERSNWRKKHLATLQQSYARAPFVKEMISLVVNVFETSDHTLASVAIRSMQVVNEYFEFEKPNHQYKSSELNVLGSGSERVLAIVRSFDGRRYVTGHGARQYLDHEAFEKQHVRVDYMQYKKQPYSQLHGEFTPYVTVLDLVANCGKEGKKYICSDAISWRQFLS